MKATPYYRTYSIGIASIHRPKPFRFWSENGTMTGEIEKSRTETGKKLRNLGSAARNTQIGKIWKTHLC